MRKALFSVVLLSVLAIGVVTFLTPAIQAAPGSNCTYYSNGSYTTVVGQFGKDCCNNVVAWGQKTKFVKCGGCFICFPPPPR